MTDEHGRGDPGSAGTDFAARTDADGTASTSGSTSASTASRTSVDRDAGATIDVPQLGTVLVTGGGGFIGGHLVDAIATRNDVRVLDTFETGSRERVPEDATVIEGDVRDRGLLAEAVTDVDVIVHLAAQVSVEESIDDPQASHETNVAATLDVLELARREGARVVIASSAAIYGDPGTVPVHETDPKRPESPYGVDKLAVDNYARVYAGRFDVPVVVLRYFNVYGPGANAGVIQAFAERAVRGSALVIHGDGEQTRDFVHVDDVVRATLAATTTPHTGSAYNVGTGERVSIGHVAERIADHVDGSVLVEHAAPRSGDVEHSQAAIDRARTRLDFDPVVDLESGLASVVRAVRERHE